MRAGLSAAQHGAALGLHGHNLDVGVVLLERTSHAGHGASRAHAGHEDVHLPVGVLPDFLTRGTLVHVGVGGVDKLSQDDCSGGLVPESVGLLDGALHALCARSEHQFRAGGAQQALPLTAHGLGHHDDGLVALDAAYPCQPHAGVAACGLDDDASGLQDALLFCVLYHVEGDAVLHASAGVEVLHLGHHLCLRILLGCQTLQVQQGGATDQFGQFLMNLCHNRMCLVKFCVLLAGVRAWGARLRLFLLLTLQRYGCATETAIPHTGYIGVPHTGHRGFAHACIYIMRGRGKPHVTVSPMRLSPSCLWPARAVAVSARSRPCRRCAT